MSGFEFLLDKSEATPQRALTVADRTIADRSNADRPAVAPVARTDLAMQPRPALARDTGQLPLDRADRELLNALAAYQIRYGKPEEALAFLQLTNRLWPEDAQTLRLLSQAFLALEDYHSAEMTEEAYLRASRSERPTRADLLRQAIIHFGRLRIGDARQSLLACFALSRHEG